MAHRDFGATSACQRLGPAGKSAGKITSATKVGSGGKRWNAFESGGSLHRNSPKSDRILTALSPSIACRRSGSGHGLACRAGSTTGARHTANFFCPGCSTVTWQLRAWLHALQRKAEAQRDGFGFRIEPVGDAQRRTFEGLDRPATKRHCRQHGYCLLRCRLVCLQVNIHVLVLPEHARHTGNQLLIVCHQGIRPN